MEILKEIERKRKEAGEEEEEKDEDEYEDGNRISVIEH